MPSASDPSCNDQSHTETKHIAVDATAGVPYNFRYSLYAMETGAWRESGELTKLSFILQAEDESPCQKGHLRVRPTADTGYDIAGYTEILGSIRASGSHTAALEQFWEKLGRGEAAFLDLTCTPASLLDANATNPQSADRLAGGILYHLVSNAPEECSFPALHIFQSVAQSSCPLM